jgi:hypothetical protein
MSVNEITPWEWDFDPWEEDPPDVIICYKFTPVVNFALTADGKRCVVNEIDLDGRVRRSAYNLPAGVASETLGPMIGPVVKERFRRRHPDLCLPEGWRPTSR